MEPIRAERQRVVFFQGLEVDGYRMPDGEFRVGLEGASVVLGYGADWLSQVVRRRPKTLKALQGMGFTGGQLEVSVGREAASGATRSKTISLDDFIRVIAYASANGKKAALALQTALVKMSLTDFFREAFGDRPLTLKEKRELFYAAYAASISPDDWREMDREDILALALPGDEPHLLWGFWNTWRR